MQHLLSMEIVGSLSENGFSLDELVMKTRYLFEEKGMAGIIELLLRLVDEEICARLVRNVAGCWRPRGCTDGCAYEFRDRRPRRFRTSAGDVEISWRRLTCKRCGKTIIPLREFLGMEPYQSKTSELEKMLMEVISEQSYRRTSRHLDLIGNIPVPKSTAHRWVAQTDSDEIATEGKSCDFLFADGTGYKRRPDKERGVTNRGELRVAIGVTDKGKVVPLGAFSGESWDEIGEKISPKNAYGTSEPISRVLVSDGEEGIATGLLRLAEDQQRCQWHAGRDARYAMWQDGANRNRQKEMERRLMCIIGIELREENFRKVAPDEKEELQKKMKAARRELDNFIGELDEKGYGRTADYVINASKRLFTYVQFWLDTGVACPRTSSLIERLMREIGRRLKRIAFGWSEKGAAKMARLIIKRITSAGEWEAYWKKRLNISNNVTLIYRGVKAA